MMKSFFCFFLILVVIQVNATDRPIIGIISEDWHDTQFSELGNQYIAASYVKFVESAGARVVPISYKTPKAELETIFHQINGLIFPGGGMNLKSGRFVEAERYLYELAIEANNKGDVFPIYGICLGFEALSVITAGDPSVMTCVFDSEDISLPLNFTKEAPTSRLFSKIPSHLYSALRTKSITMNNHHCGVSVNSFHSNTKLNSFFRILSTNQDPIGQHFVSTIESREYPIIGTQWHPEKNIYEWTRKEVMHHDAVAVEASQYFVNYFVSLARQSTHSFFNSTEEAKALIYNYSPVYTQDLNLFTQSYVSDFGYKN
eukprot:GCRY01001148.1.p1 GENE.GCRY01001148.1~~GCRY01001148.1.p1  ORF type:complete len:316 (+),score=33.89 GCRY01001148.1:92-1039(+)